MYSLFYYECPLPFCQTEHAPDHKPVNLHFLFCPSVRIVQTGRQTPVHIGLGLSPWQHLKSMVPRDHFHRRRSSHTTP